MKPLNKDEREELEALAEHCDALRDGHSFMHRSHWRGLYQGLVQRGLVRWEKHPSMGPEFALTSVTDAGRAALASE